MEPFRENAFINVLNNCNAEAIKDTKSTGVKKRTRENRKKYHFSWTGLCRNGKP